MATTCIVHAVISMSVNNIVFKYIISKHIIEVAKTNYILQINKNMKCVFYTKVNMAKIIHLSQHLQTNLAAIDKILSIQIIHLSQLLQTNLAAIAKILSISKHIAGFMGF